MRALLSAYDKTGLIDLAAGLKELSVDLIASGKTHKLLSENSIDSMEVAQLTGSKEMLGGRVKTLHPVIHGGILADRSQQSHMQDLSDNGILPIDIVVCNLYPFQEEPCVEMIDVGGPTMVRAAAKNYQNVIIMVDPSDYGEVLDELKTSGSVSLQKRASLARKAFAHTAAYDGAIVEWFDDNPDMGNQTSVLPPTVHLSLERVQGLRYGENPHQSGARYKFMGGKPSVFDTGSQLSGKELSYLNIFDAEAAWSLAHEIRDLAPDKKSAVAIIKHANPCGVAVSDNIYDAYEMAYEADALSAFGGIVAIPAKIDLKLASMIVANNLCDVLIAYDIDGDALELISGKRKNTRILRLQPPSGEKLSFRQISGGFLIQEPDTFIQTKVDFRTVTDIAPTDKQWEDIELAWRTCARTTSNAIVIAKNNQVIGVGCGQQSRVDAALLACKKASDRAEGSVSASDAFFPFRDGLDVLVDHGIKAIIHPGGSLRDEEIIKAANERGIAMVLTGERHFRH